MKLDFDTYEFAGLVAPGSVVVFALALFRPAWLHVADAAVTIAAAVVAAYVLGHLVAAIGNLAEPLFVAVGAVRLQHLDFTQWPKKPRCYLSLDQVEPLQGLVGTTLHGDLGDPAQRGRIVKQMYLFVFNAGHAERLETFNGLYNLSRGLVVAFLIALALSLFAREYGAAAFCAAGTLLALYRVRKFNDIYSRELVLQFMLLAGNDSTCA